MILRSRSVARTAAALCLLVPTLLVEPGAAHADNPPRPVDATVIAPEAALDDAARTVLREAVEAANKGDFATCRTKAAGVWDSIKHPLAAGVLGSCEVELGQYRSGAEHLRLAIDHDTGKSASRLETLKGDYEKAKAKISILSVQASVEGADVLLDGVFVGKAPIRIYLDPGTRSLEVRAGANPPKRQTLELTAGKELVLVIPFGASRADPGVPPPIEGRAAWPAIVMGSVAAVGVGVGIGLLVAGLGNEGDVEGQPCPAGDPARCPDLASAVDQRNAMVVGGSVTIGVGAAAAIGMIVYLALPEGGAAEAEENKRSPSPSARFVPVLGPAVLGLSLEGRF